MRDYCYLWERARNARLNGRAGGCFPKSNDKNVTVASCNIDVLLQVLRHLFKISTTVSEFNTFLTCLLIILSFKKYKKEGSATLASVLTREEGLGGDVHMIKIFQ